MNAPTTRARDAVAASFRLATAADATLLGVLGTQVFLDTYATRGIRAALAAEVLEHFSGDAIASLLARADTFFVLAEHEGHLIGFAHVVTGAHHALVSEASPAEVHRLYVHERFTGRGLGRALLRQAEAYAAAHGADVLWLTSWVENRRAIAFYPRCGYEDRGATFYEFQGDRYDNRLYARRLAHRSPAPAAPAAPAPDPHPLATLPTP